MEMVRVCLWRLLALLFLLSGIIGIVLPGWPTTIFVILAAWAGGKGWPALEVWLLNHPRYGQHIRNWRENGAMPRKAKCWASTMMLISIAIICLSPVPNVVKIGVPLLLCAIMLWIWRRPEPVCEHAVQANSQAPASLLGKR